MRILNLKNRIMLRVYAIYCARKAASPFVGESLAFAILAALLSIFVSIPNVLANLFNAGDFYNFFIAAFARTDLIVQMILVLVLIPVIFFIKDIATLAQLVEQRYRKP